MGSNVKPIELLKELKKLSTGAHPDGKLSPIYIVYGEEMFVRERTVQRLKQTMERLNGSTDRVTFEKIDMNEWTSSLYNIPMFSSIRLVIASELSDLKDKELDPLLEYVKNPSPDVVLLLLSYRIDRRKKKLSELLNYGLSCKAKSPKGKELPLWINGFAAERGKAIDFQAIEFLKTGYDGNLSKIEKEIEKTVLYIADKDIIEKEDIEFISTGISTASVFDIFPLLASRNKKALFQILYKLISSGQKPLMVLSVIINRIKKLLLADDVLSSGVSDSDLANVVDIPIFFLGDFRRELKNYKRKELTNMYKRCMNIDSQLKSSRRSDVDIFISGMLDLVEHR